MWKWLCGLFKTQPKEAPPVGGDLLALQRQLQSLRLDLEERDRAMANLRNDLERERREREARVAEAVQVQMERLLSEAAAPVAQLLTQAYLLETEGKPLQAKDVLAVARRLIAVLEESGLVLEGKAGEVIPYDPARHTPLAAETANPGQEVRVRFAGVSYHGKILRKAGVEKA